MSPRRILLTGGSGFVGGHLRSALATRFPDAEVLDPFTADPDFDIADAAAVDAAVAAVRPDASIHLAAISAVPAARDDPDRAWRVNLHGTLSLARSLLAYVPDSPLLFASTAEIYGASFARLNTGGGGLDETAAPAPANTYAASKAAADLALGAMAQEGLRVIRARPFNHTGPGQSDAFVVPAFARQIARIAAGLQEPVMAVGALDPARDFLDVRDVCRCYAACLAHAGDMAPGTILNIASGTPRRIGDVLDALIAMAGISVELHRDAGRFRRTDIPLAYGDASRARELLGWAPQIPWETTLADVLHDWQARTAAA